MSPKVPRRPTSRRSVLTWFGLIGIANAAIDLMALNLLLAIWPTRTIYGLVIINSLAYSFAVTNSYYWNSRITFKQQSTYSTQEKLKFVVQALISLFINNLVFILFGDVLGLSLPQLATRNMAKLISALASSTCSFVFMRRLVFYRPSKSS